jgi:hypothetical protein
MTLSMVIVSTKRGVKVVMRRRDSAYVKSYSLDLRFSCMTSCIRLDICIGMI